MNVFKKIGNAVKTGLKQVSIKNVMKVAPTVASFIPYVGTVASGVLTNINEAHAAKKAAEEAERVGNAEQAEYYRQVAEQQAMQAGAQTGAVAGSTLKTFSKGFANEIKAQTSDTTKSFIGDIGASMTDQTIKSWFLSHWKMLLAVLGVLVGVFIFWKKSGNSNNKKSYRK